MTSDIAFAIALTAGVFAIFVSSIPTEHRCPWQHCPHRKREEDNQ